MCEGLFDGDKEDVQLLLEKGADVNTQARWTFDDDGSILNSSHSKTAISSI